MGSTLVRGKYLIAGTSAPGEVTVIEDGAFVQRDGLIVEVGAYADLAARHRPDETLGSSRHVVMPGLVNGHHHVGLTPLQLGSLDYPLELWLASRVAARDVDPYLDTLYSAFEMIESGVTTVQHLHGMRRGPVTAWPDRARRVLEAYRDIGMRTSYSFGIRDQNQVVYGPDDEFVQRLPSALQPEIAEWLGDMRISFEDWSRDLFEGLYETWGRNQSDLVRIWLAPANLHWCSDKLLMQVKERAQKFGVGIHIHVLETVYQKIYAHRRSGQSAVQHLHALGFLGPEVTLGHGVWLTSEDVDRLAETGTCVCHNASSNLRLQSGIAPLNDLMARGVRVALGIDEAGLNDDRDMLQEMRLVLKLHRVPGMEQRVPTAAEVFSMATEGGAHTTGFGERIGRIAPGRSADAVLIDLRNVTEPYLDPLTPILEGVVHRARAVDVDTVMIAGEVVMRDRRFTRVDKDEVLRDLRTALGAPLRPDEIRRRELSRELLPQVRRFYSDWSLEAGDPWYARNNR